VYDKALTLFDRIEEHLAQKTTSAPQTKKSVNIVAAIAESSSPTPKNSSSNPPAAFTVEESSSSSTSEDDGDRDGDKSGIEEAEDPSPLKKDMKSKDDDDDGLFGGSEAVPYQKRII
jgi:hypothetical protein